MKRRTFFGTLAAFVAAPFVKPKTNEELIEELSLSNARLKELARKFPPAPEWYYDTFTFNDNVCYIGECIHTHIDSRGCRSLRVKWKQV